MDAPDPSWPSWALSWRFGSWHVFCTGPDLTRVAYCYNRERLAILGKGCRRLHALEHWRGRQ